MIGNPFYGRFSKPKMIQFLVFWRIACERTAIRKKVRSNIREASTSLVVTAETILEVEEMEVAVEDLRAREAEETIGTGEETHMMGKTRTKDLLFKTKHTLFMEVWFMAYDYNWVTLTLLFLGVYSK